MNRKLLLLTVFIGTPLLAAADPQPPQVPPETKRHVGDRDQPSGHPKAKAIFDSPKAKKANARDLEARRPTNRGQAATDRPHDRMQRDTQEFREEQRLAHKEELEARQHSIRLRELREQEIRHRSNREHGGRERGRQRDHERLEHLHLAAEHLERAGLDELAREVIEEAKELEEDLGEANEDEELHHMIHEMHRHLEQLHREVQELRRELREVSTKAK